MHTFLGRPYESVVVELRRDSLHRDVDLHEYDDAIGGRDLRKEHVSFDVGDVVRVRRVRVYAHFDVLSLAVLQEEPRSVMPHSHISLSRRLRIPEANLIAFGVVVDDSVQAKKDEVLVVLAVPLRVDLDRPRECVLAARKVHVVLQVLLVAVGEVLHRPVVFDVLKRRMFCYQFLHVFLLVLAVICRHLTESTYLYADLGLGCVSKVRIVRRRRINGHAHLGSGRLHRALVTWLHTLKK